MYETLASVAGFVFLYSLSSRGLEQTPINGAILFTAFGIIFGPLGLDYLKFNPGTENLRTLAEVTLALLLFTDMPALLLPVKSQSMACETLGKASAKATVKMGK